MRIANAEEMADFWMNARCEVRGENVCESGGGGGLIVGKEKRVGQKRAKYEQYRFGLV